MCWIWQFWKQFWSLWFYSYRKKGYLWGILFLSSVLLKELPSDVFRFTSWNKSDTCVSLNYFLIKCFCCIFLFCFNEIEKEHTKILEKVNISIFVNIICVIILLPLFKKMLYLVLKIYKIFMEYMFYLDYSFFYLSILFNEIVITFLYEFQICLYTIFTLILSMDYCY